MFACLIGTALKRTPDLQEFIDRAVSPDRPASLASSPKALAFQAAWERLIAEHTTTHEEQVLLHARTAVGRNTAALS